MKRKNVMVVALIMAFVMLVTPLSASATIIYENVNSEVKIVVLDTAIPFEEPWLLEDIGSISTKQNLEINEIEYPMYCTFDDPDLALTNIANEIADVLALLEREYELEEFSADTVEVYYGAALQMLDDKVCPDWYNEGNDEFRKFAAFYDIYENEAKNAMVSMELETYNEMVTINSVEDSPMSIVDREFLMMLPYNSYETAMADNNLSLEPAVEIASTVLGFDTSLGIAYAKRYAENPNTDEYKDFGSSGDCANFTSQILENGGVSQVVTDSAYTGWWHKTSTFLGFTTHSHSNSWTVADTFARYMGVYKSTTSNYTFSTNIVAGDFVTLDKTSDGDWDHMGFVTGKQAYMASDGYYDYQIAQHTSNYLAWASSSTNSWEKVEDDGGTYARVRRSS